MSARLFGHAIHPMLIVFPLGLLATSVIFDVAYLATHHAAFANVAYWNIAGGVIGGLVAAAFGLGDWLGIPRGTRAKSIGAWHALVNVLVLVCFAASWIVRRPAAGHVPAGNALLLSFGALVLALVSGWLGGELVERLGVGVYDDAHLNAPSSLSGRSVVGTIPDRGHAMAGRHAGGSRAQ